MSSIYPNFSVRTRGLFGDRTPSLFEKKATALSLFFFLQVLVFYGSKLFHSPENFIHYKES